MILVTVTSIIAGSYPSLFLASFKPIRILKGNISAQSGNTASVRKGLVIVQFALSAFLIVGMLAVSKQVNYIQNKNLGFDKDHIIYVPLEGDVYKKIETYQNELNNVHDLEKYLKPAHLNRMINLISRLDINPDSITWCVPNLPSCC